jgi:REP element-mobilizing transposase RayT
MTRPLRKNMVGGWYHVFGRGLERREIFADDRDQRHLLELLAEMRERYRIVVHAYVLMTNHYHAILQTPDANLSAGMQWYHGSYAAWYNVRHHRVGPLFQGRYRALPIENGAWAYALSQYIHLNPLRIKACGLDERGRMMEGQGYREPTAEEVSERFKKLRDYRWSSYRAYAGYEDAPEWLETRVLLERAAKEPERRQIKYRQIIRQRLSYGVEPSHREGLFDAVALGSAAFGKRIRALAGDALGLGIGGRRALRRRATLAEVHQALATLKGNGWARSMTKLRGDYYGRALFLWAGRRWCGCTLRELGEAAGGMSYAAVSIALKRFAQRSATDIKVQELQSSLTKLLKVEP